MRRQGIAVSTRPLSGTFRNRLMKRVRGEYAAGWLRRTRPQLLVISQGGNLDGLAWMEGAAGLGIPFVTIAQMANESYWPPADISDRAAAVYPAAEKCLFVSESNRRLTEMQIACRLPRASIVRNPVNIPEDVSLPMPWPASRDGVFRFAAVGRLAPCAKGQDVIFQALALPKWRNRPVQVSLFGEGFFHRSMERLIAMMGLENVHLAGHVSRIDQVWANHHALLMASRYEGLPLALVEAMLCGRVPVVTDVAGNSEIVTDGETGFIAKAAKPACLDEAMERAWELRDCWPQIGAAAATAARLLIPEDPVEDLLSHLLQANGCSPRVRTSAPAVARAAIVS
jgi:glycosyltransferase involved in cell wall biosynthesis